MMTDAAPQTPVTLASGLKFPEGPALAPDGKMLYVLNAQDSTISRLDLKTQELTYAWVTLPDGGQGNGSTFGPDGALYVTDVKRKLIARVSLPAGEVTTIVDKTPDGSSFRGPNDLTFDKNGGLYFTDPVGTWDKPIASVYYIAPETQAVSQVAEGVQFPNGLALSPDEQTLYVAESPLHRIIALDLTANGVIPPSQKRVFCVTGTVGGADGMRMGHDGFLYAAIFEEGFIAKIAPSGEIVHRYPVVVGKNCTNLCFSQDRKSLYVTEMESNSVVQLRL